MKLRMIVLGLIPFMMGCAAFKQLKPEPKVQSEEGAYIQIKDDGEAFELDKGKKYFIEFPASAVPNYYVLLDVKNKENIVTGMASRFDEDKGILQRIANEAPADAAEAAYPLDENVQKFYWVIEEVHTDEFILDLNYRYLPKWRYKFETQYQTFKNILSANQADRNTYENIGTSIALTRLNFAKMLQTISGKNDNLKSLTQQMASIEKLFPASILNTQDEAYQNYLSLKEDIQIELTFQENFSAALRHFQNLMLAENDMPRFAQLLNELLPFYDDTERFSSNILTEAKRVLQIRLDELTPFYEELIRNKKDITPVALDVNALNTLYEKSTIKKAPAYKKLAAFITDFNQRANAVAEVEATVKSIQNKIAGQSKWPTNSFFGSLVNDLSAAKRDLPATSFRKHSSFSSTTCVKKLVSKIHSLHSSLIRQNEDYKRANNLVSQLNRLATQKAYREMIKVLKQNRGLTFLSGLYSGLDKKSVLGQQKRIVNALQKQDWRGAEEGLRALHLDTVFLNPKSINPTKRVMVKAMEDTLLNRVERVTRQKVARFVEEKYTELNDVDGLYNDPVFKAAWDITFTAGSQSDLLKRKQKLNTRLKSLKEIEFPAKAIKALYKDFNKNINANGVLKARAIVSHGAHYKGTDKKLKRLMAECDPWASKWITKQGAYRKLYALPTSNNPQGENTYVFRVNFRIPTDAYFATWDVNVKLPKEVAGSAGTSAWYERMTMNKKLLKPEGRFTITAPNAKNNYTALIAPLEVVKNGDSVFEVRFKHDSFKVFEVSINAQEPILRKN